MIPYRDHNPSRITPVLTIGLVMINVLVFLLELYVFANGGEEAFFDSYAIIPAQLLTNPIGEAFTVISAMFLHGGWMHLLGNMLYLWIFGDNIEASLGKVRFILFYLLSGLAATFAQVLIDPTSAIPNIGASGAIAGVLGGYLALYPRAQVDTLVPIGLGFMRTISIPAVLVLGFWFVYQLFIGVMSLGGSGGGVAYFAHIGGFAAGFLMMMILRGSIRRRQYPTY